MYGTLVFSTHSNVQDTHDKDPHMNICVWGKLVNDSKDYGLLSKRKKHACISETPLHSGDWAEQMKLLKNFVSCNGAM